MKGLKKDCKALELYMSCVRDIESDSAILTKFTESPENISF